jgi:hypothetical protein
MAFVFAVSSNAVCQCEKRFGEAGISDESGLVKFVEDVRSAFERNDVLYLASVTQFPLQIGPAQDNYSLTRADFVKKYESEVKPALREGFSKYLGPCSLYVDSQGVAIGDGELWISELRTSPSTFEIEFLNLSKFLPAGLSMAEAKSADTFLKLIISTARTGDAFRLCQDIQIPLNVQIEKRSLVISTRRQCRQLTRQVFPSALLRALSRQDVSDGIAMTDGIMMLDGTVWIRAVDGRFRVVSINLGDRYASRK